MKSQRRPKAPNRAQPNVHQAPWCTKAIPKKCAQDVQWNQITLIGQLLLLLRTTDLTEKTKNQWDKRSMLGQTHTKVRSWATTHTEKPNSKETRMECWVREGEEQSYNSQRVPTAMRLEWHTGSEKSPNSNETENENGMLGQKHTKVRSRTTTHNRTQQQWDENHMLGQRHKKLRSRAMTHTETQQQWDKKRDET